MKELIAKPWLGPLVCALLLISLMTWCSTHGTTQEGQLSRRQKAALQKAKTAAILAGRQDSIAAAKHLDSANFYLAQGRAWADSARYYENYSATDTSLAALRRVLAKHH